MGIEWVIIRVGPSTPTMTHPIHMVGSWWGWVHYDGVVRVGNDPSYMFHGGIVWVMMGLGVGWAMGKAGNDEGVVGNGRCRVGYVMVEGMGGSHWW